eukprot:CAMPEP_0197517960 /NCGR_PEP_ID=MMETSP1318-20131121/3052_1 /TAXON_ID=552666 /ORGANISM="Partenskyella glossopodia, Strain RCC365" /LENGTH=231 /DNA_ID=CAMNT_0043067933 /DNA_START=23 /DNA_END=718 /DNA_ORIENTATION=+
MRVGSMDSLDLDSSMETIPEIVGDTDKGRRAKKKKRGYALLSKIHHNVRDALTETNITLAVSILTLLSTVVLQTWYTVVTQNMHYVSTFDSIYNEYSVPEMLNAFDTVEDFIANHGRERFADEFMEHKKARNRDKISHVDHARRRVVHWYAKVCLFWKKGLIPLHFLKSFPGKGRAAYFLRNFEPLEESNRMIYGGTPNEAFSCIRRMFDIPEDMPGKCSYNFGGAGKCPI